MELFLQKYLLTIVKKSFIINVWLGHRYVSVAVFILRQLEFDQKNSIEVRSGSRTAATSKVELFVIIVNGWKQRPPSWMLQQS